MVACSAFHVHCVVIISLYLFKCRGLSQLIAFWPALTVKKNRHVEMCRESYPPFRLCVSLKT